MSEGTPATEQFAVVVNDEEQYSIWKVGTAPPPGWHSVRVASRDECLRYIAEVWTDLRPLSLRRSMADQDQSARGT